MKQQINLYLLLPKRTGFYLTQRNVTIYYILFTIFLMIIYFFQWVHKNNLQKQFDIINQDLQKLQAEVNVLNQQYPITDSQGLKNSIDTLKTQIINKSAALNLISPYRQFSSFLEALANAATEGVWYTDIMFVRGENNVNLKGFAAQTILINSLLDKLAKQPVFKSYSFNVLEINEEKLPANFSIVSKRVNNT